MAFANRIGNVLKRAVSGHMNLESTHPNSSLYQAYRSMSSSKLFVGGLSYGTDEMSLKEAFDQFGTVVEARIIMDRETGRSRGFGFVSFAATDSAINAMQALDGQDLHGRRIRVNYATEKPRTGFGGGGGYGNYGRGDGGYGGGGSYGGGYGGGGSYGGGDGYAGGGGNYNSGGGDYGSGGGYGTNYGNNASYNSNYAAQETNFDGGNSGNFGVSSGNFTADTGFDGTVGTAGYGGGPQQMNAEQEISEPANPSNGNYRDDIDEPDGYANNTRS